MSPPPKIKIRVRFRRDGKIRFISHRDTARLMERAIRKIGLPIAYSEGFSPRPRIAFGLALTVAYESDAEFLDIDLVTPVDCEGLPERLTDALPDGLTVDAAVPLENGSESLQQAIVSCSWLVEVLGSHRAPAEPADDVTTDTAGALGANVDEDIAALVVAVEEAVAAVLAAPELPLERERKGKVTVADVRPAILDLEVTGPTEHGVQLNAVLATETVTLRPAELVRVLGDEFREGRVRRTHQWTRVDGIEQEPVNPSSANRSAELAGMRDS